METLLNACKDTQVYLPVFLAVTTGMRRAEIAGLRWSDVDYENKMIYIKNSLQRINGELTLVPTKTDRSRRAIALLDMVAKTLKQYKVLHAKNKLMLGEEYQDLDFVCAWPDGRPTSCDYITNEFVKLRDKLDIPKIRFHDLRHTHATLLLKMGVNPKIVQERLGHSTISTTMDIYSHALPEMQKEAAEKLEEKLFSRKVK
nr:site-specific integrase [Clostridium formicaceticum]